MHPNCIVLPQIREHTPGAKARSCGGPMRPKAKALGYLEAEKRRGLKSVPLIFYGGFCGTVETVPFRYCPQWGGCGGSRSRFLRFATE
jgi:hypothetical protein